MLVVIYCCRFFMALYLSPLLLRIVFVATSFRSFGLVPLVIFAFQLILVTIFYLWYFANPLPLSPLPYFQFCALQSTRSMCFQVFVILISWNLFFTDMLGFVLLAFHFLLYLEFLFVIAFLALRRKIKGSGVLPTDVSLLPQLCSTFLSMFTCYLFGNIQL